MTPERRLAAILAADMVGYSQLIERDEAGTVARLKADREALIDPTIAAHGGRIVRLAGDGALVEFPSVVEAAQCAIDIQRAMPTRNAERPEDQHIVFRMGVNLGDIIVEDDNLHGEGINVAARLESIADPGGILVSEEVARHVDGKVSASLQFIGERSVKNIERPLRVWGVILDERVAEPGERPVATGHHRAAIALGLALVTVAAGFAWLWSRVPDADPAQTERMAFPLPDRPSIAVLPFDDLSDDGQQGRFADGITENLIATLSQIPELFVISRNSTFTYKATPVRVQTVAEELGVRYVLEGSVQRSHERVRITAQLIDAIQGHHLWSERYDREVDDLFTLQDEIALKTIIALQVKLSDGEQARVLSRTTENVKAWLRYTEAFTNFMQFSRESNARSRDLANEALALDPGFTDALILVGFTHVIDARSGYSSSREASLRLATELAKEAKTRAPDAPMLYNLIQSIHRLNGEFDLAMEAGERAISLSPSTSVSLLATAMTSHFAGRFERSVELAKETIRHDPHYPSVSLLWLGWSNWFLGRYGQAMAAGNEALARAESASNAAVHHLTLALSHVGLGEIAEAKRSAKEAHALSSQFTIEYLRKGFPYEDPANQKRLLDALRTAGLPEGG